MLDSGRVNNKQFAQQFFNHQILVRLVELLLKVPESSLCWPCSRLSKASTWKAEQRLDFFHGWMPFFFVCFDVFLGGDVSIHRSEVGSRCSYIYIYIHIHVIFVAEKMKMWNQLASWNIWRELKDVDGCWFGVSFFQMQIVWRDSGQLGGQ